MANTMVAGEAYCKYNCADTNGTYQYLIKHHVFGNRTHAFIKGYLYNTDLEVIHNKKNWWRSEEAISKDNHYLGLMTSRNWILIWTQNWPRKLSYPPLCSIFRAGSENRKGNLPKNPKNQNKKQKI